MKNLFSFKIPSSIVTFTELKSSKKKNITNMNGVKSDVFFHTISDLVPDMMHAEVESATITREAQLFIIVNKTHSEH